MSLRHKLRALFRKDTLEAEMTEEMRHHVELQTELNLKAGLNAEDARYAALRQFGNVAVIQEQAREGRGWVWLEQAAQDARYACRQLLRAPGFTCIVVLTLGLGIGGTTALVSVVNTVILNPIDGKEPERLVQVGQIGMTGKNEFFQRVSAPVLDALVANREKFDGLIFGQTAGLERKNEDFIKTENGAYVSPDFFELLGCRPLLGRGFLPDEAALIEQGAPVRDTTIVLSYGWWQSQWGGDGSILGRKIEMGGRQFTVVGIMPEHFRFPDVTIQYWIPYERKPVGLGAGGAATIWAFGRLKAGAAPASAQPMLDVLARQLMASFGAGTNYGRMWRAGHESGLRIAIRPLSEMLQNGEKWTQLRQTLLGLSGAVGFVLLIVCANVANLLLVRIERRQHELAVRAAIGAGRGRLVRQLMVENLLLALAGGAAGLLLAIWGLDVLTAMNSLPRLRAAGLDSQMLATALVISGATTLCFGLAPAWRGARTRVQEVLVDGGLGATGGRKGVFFRDLLVVMQVAVAMVLLAGAGLMWASVSRILRIEPGFDPENLLTVEVQAPWRGTQKREDREKAKNLLVSQLLERLQVVPGVVAAGLQEQSFTQSFELDGKPDALRGQHVLAATGEGDVFRAMRMPLLDGRYFEATDNARPEVIIINETLARQAWPGESAIGKTLGRGDPTSPKFEVVGVVGDVRISGYLQAPTPTIYHPYLAPWSRTTLIGGAGAQFVIRTAVEPELLIPLVRNELKQAGSTLLTPSFRIASGVLHDSTLVQRTYRNYLGVFALLGLVLAALGVYGVLAFSVARRTREIGIRMAVGATGAQVCRMIMSRGGVLVAAGSLLGLGGVWALGKLLRSQLFGISPTDPGVLSGALLALLFSGLFACWLPARRAARVDPITALRTE